MAVCSLALSVLADEPNQAGPAVLGVQGNWPLTIKTMGKKARTYSDRKANFSKIPEFLQGLQYTLHYRKKIVTLSCRVKTSGWIYLCLFGDKTPKSIGQYRDWKKCGIMRGPSFRGKNKWTIYQTDVRAGEILTLPQPDKLGLTIAAKKITVEKTRPIPKMPEIVAVYRHVAGKSVEKRPVEYFIFGQGQDVTFIMAAIHGHEQMGIPLVQRLAVYLHERQNLLHDRKVILMPMANPDGVAYYHRFNARGVDINRNFKATNRRNGGRNGPRALSEPEAHIIKRLIQKYSPDRIISIHQPVGPIDSKAAGMVDYEGPAEALASRMSEYCNLPVKRWGTQPGSLGAYAGETLRIPIVTLELPKYNVELSSESLWEKYGTALIAAVVYPDRVSETHDVEFSKMKSSNQ